jgi:hypothetical protein
MKKSILLFILLTVVTFAFSANVVPVEKAKLVSKNFMTELTGHNDLTTSDFVLVYTETDENGEPLYYCFQFRSQGFVMVSATEFAQPILSFSFEKNFELNGLNNYFMLKYRDEITMIKKDNALSKGYSADWTHYSAENFVPKVTKGGAGVEPLTTTEWSQEKYYNTYCPFDSRPSTTVTPQTRDYKALNGCVAVNMTNLLFYHRWPMTGNNGVSYIPVDEDGDTAYTYPRQTVNFGQNTYNYNVMYDGSLNTYVNELAKLFYHTGVSTYMAYGNNGSGSNSSSALNALKINWKMNQFAANYEKDDMVSSAAFVDTITAQLDRNLPVYMGANISGEDGHAFIIDGYIVSGTNKYLHVNFGWGGYKNGYYAFGNLDGYNQDENIIANIFPNVADSILKPAISIDTVTATLGTISDGSGYIKYQKNSNRQWFLSSAGATSYTFNFSKIKTEADGDIITIYNGPTAASGIKAQFSGNYLMKGAGDNQGDYPSNFTGTALPASVTVTSSTVLVTFTSNSNDVVDYGFVLSYDANIASNSQTCSTGIIAIPATQVSGTISDKIVTTGDDVTYAPERACYFSGKSFYFCDGFAMAFTKFDLLEGDYVEVWSYENKLTSTLPELVKKFDINNKPDGSFMVNKGLFMVNFVSDNWRQGTGFKLDYYAILGVNDINEIENINVYPNPTSGQLNVALTTTLNDDVTFQIVDMMGKIVSSETIAINGNYTYTTTVNDLSSGIYMVNVITSKGKSIHKFIVE